MEIQYFLFSVKQVRNFRKNAQSYTVKSKFARKHSQSLQNLDFFIKKFLATVAEIFY